MAFSRRGIGFRKFAVARRAERVARPDATTAIKAAIDGQPGHARLAARISMAGRPASVHEATATAEVLAPTSEGAPTPGIQADYDASVEASEPVTREVTADLQIGSPPPVAETVHNAARRYR